MVLDPEMTAYDTVTIATGDTESTVLCKKHRSNIAIFLPANWVTGTITFKGCLTEDGTFVPVVKGSDVAAITIPSIAASQCIVLDNLILKALAPVPYIMLVAGAAQITDDKIITIVMTR